MITVDKGISHSKNAIENTNASEYPQKLVQEQTYYSFVVSNKQIK